MNTSNKLLESRIVAGDDSALSEWLERNKRLIIKIARGYSGEGFTLEDFVQEGMIGAITAAREFKPEMGRPFSAFASMHIRWAIQKAYTLRGGLVGAPGTRKKRGDSQHASLLEIDAPISEGDDRTHDLADPTAHLYGESASLDADRILHALPILGRERWIVTNRIMGEMTLHQCGIVLGVSRERVRQIEGAVQEIMSGYRANPARLARRVKRLAYLRRQYQRNKSTAWYTNAIERGKRVYWDKKLNDPAAHRKRLDAWNAWNRRRRAATFDFDRTCRGCDKPIDKPLGSTGHPKVWCSRQCNYKAIYRAKRGNRVVLTPAEVCARMRAAKIAKRVK